MNKVSSKTSIPMPYKRTLRSMPFKRNTHCSMGLGAVARRVLARRARGAPCQTHTLRLRTTDFDFCHNCCLLMSLEQNAHSSNSQCGVLWNLRKTLPFRLRAMGFTFFTKRLCFNELYAKHSLFDFGLWISTFIKPRVFQYTHSSTPTRGFRFLLKNGFQ